MIALALAFACAVPADEAGLPPLPAAPEAPPPVRAAPPF